MEENHNKILLVDDEKDLSKVTAWTLEDAGYNVSCARSGNEALKLLKDGQYDFVLSDIKMADGDGVELLKKIKEQGISLKGTFLMTGFSNYPEQDLHGVGMTKLFHKPVDLDEIISEFKKIKTLN